MYKFLSPDQKQKRELKKKIDGLNLKIDKMVEKCQTDKPEYQNLIRLHYSFFKELQ